MRRARSLAVALAVLGFASTPALAATPAPPAARSAVTLKAVVNVRALSGAQRKAGPKVPKLPRLSPHQHARVAAGASGTPVPLAPARPRAGAPAVTTAASENMLQSFPAMGLEQQVAAFGTDQAAQPPDTQLAAGTANLVELTNDSLSVWTKSGLRVAIADLDVFFGVPAGAGFSDPKIFFEPYTQRWYASGFATGAGSNSQVLLAVSQTVDPLQNWNIFAVTPVSSGVLHDQPKFANNATSIVMSWDDFQVCTTDPTGFCFLGGNLIALEKSDLLAASPTVVHSDTLYSGNQAIFGAVGVQKLTSSPYAEFVWNTNDTNSYSEAAFEFVQGTPSNPPSMILSGSSVNMPATVLPPMARQAGSGSALIQTDDDRFVSVAFQSDSAVQWVMANEGCFPSGGVPTATCMRLIQVTPQSVCNYSCFSPTINQLDIGSASDDYYYPAATIDTAGNVYVAYTHSGPALFPSAESFGIAAGTLTPTGSNTIWNGTTPYDSRLCGADNRWGDYSGAAIDPSDPTVAWLAAEASNSAEPCDWRTAIGQLTFSGPRAYGFTPSPIGAPGTLGSSSTMAVSLTVPGPAGTTVYLSFQQAPGGGSATVGTTALTGTPRFFTSDGTGQVSIAYTTAATSITTGTDVITAADAPGNPLATATDAYSYASTIAALTMSPNPIAPQGSLDNTRTLVDLLVRDSSGAAMAGTTVYLSSGGAGAGYASVNGTALVPTPAAFTTGVSGDIMIAYQTPSPLPNGGTDTIIAQNKAAAPTVTTSDSYTYATTTTFYFAEGFTGSGFQTILAFLVPHQNGTVLLDFYTQFQHVHSAAFLTAGYINGFDAVGAVGANQNVSARVTLPGPGVAERVMHFNNGTWHGSTDVVGVNAPAREWDFAEGSTLSAFNEFLSLQNPNAVSVNVTLNYATDISAQPTKQLVLPPMSRTTIQVFKGDLTSNANCDPLTTCGVGSGVVGVSVQVLSDQPIVAERPMYVMSYSFGAGPIRDGHDAFGANAPSSTWYFAEGNTINGFNEYLTLQNPSVTPATVTLHYIYDSGTKDVQLNLGARSRQTALVFDAAHFGVGRAYVGVSVKITSTMSIVAERPMYMYFAFSGNGGSGPVAGAHDVVGATALSTLFGFAYADTLSGDSDYLTIENPNTSAASVTISYYTDGGLATKVITVAGQSRHTVLMFVNGTDGIGSGFPPFGVVVSSVQPVLVEKPTYSSNAAIYGATDTVAYSPAGF